MNTLIAKNALIETSLTTESPLSRYGIPVLRVTTPDGSKDFGPSDFIPGLGVTAAEYIGTMNEMFGPAEGSDLFLSQVPA